MRDINRRLAKAEKVLNINRQRPRVLIVNNSIESELVKTLPENVEEWLTYKKKLRKCPNTPFLMLLTSEELYARGLTEQGNVGEIDG